MASPDTIACTRLSAHAASVAVTSDDVASRPLAAVISPDLIAPLAGWSIRRWRLDRQERPVC
jgi:hypothetical protein